MTHFWPTFSALFLAIILRCLFQTSQDPSKTLPRRPKTAQDGHKTTQEPPKSSPGVPKSCPRASKSCPRAFQERQRRPRSAQEPPKTAQELPKSRPRWPGAAQDAPRTRPRPAQIRHRTHALPTTWKELPTSPRNPSELPSMPQSGQLQKRAAAVLTPRGSSIRQTTLVSHGRAQDRGRIF